jgi:hypothetical protein
MTNVQKKEVSGETSKPIITEKVPTVKRTKTVVIERVNKNTGKVTKFTYAKVAARLAEFHLANDNGSIRTTETFIGQSVVFKTVLTPNVTNPDRVFTGTAFGKVMDEKSFEKLETIAVGRALAFAGYLADGEIASMEEMAKYEEPVIQVDSESAIAKLNTAKNLAELQLVWQRLTAAERQNEDIAFTKEELKSAFMEVEGENI